MREKLMRLGVALAGAMLTGVQAARADSTDIDIPVPATLALLGAAIGGKLLLDAIRRR